MIIRRVLGVSRQECTASGSRIIEVFQKRAPKFDLSLILLTFEVFAFVRNTLK